MIIEEGFVIAAWEQIGFNQGAPMMGWKRWSGPWPTIDIAQSIRDRAAAKHKRPGLCVCKWAFGNESTEERYWNGNIFVESLEAT